MTIGTQTAIFIFLDLLAIIWTIGSFTRIFIEDNCFFIPNLIFVTQAILLDCIIIITQFLKFLKNDLDYKLFKITFSGFFFNYLLGFGLFIKFDIQNPRCLLLSTKIFIWVYYSILSCFFLITFGLFAILMYDNWNFLKRGRFHKAKIKIYNREIEPNFDLDKFLDKLKEEPNHNDDMSELDKQNLKNSFTIFCNQDQNKLPEKKGVFARFADQNFGIKRRYLFIRFVVILLILIVLIRGFMRMINAMFALFGLLAQC